MSTLEHDIMRFRHALTTVPQMAGRPVFTGQFLDLNTEVTRKAFTAAFTKRHKLSEADLAGLDAAIQRHIGDTIRVNADCWTRLTA